MDVCGAIDTVGYRVWWDELLLVVLLGENPRHVCYTLIGMM